MSEQEFKEMLKLYSKQELWNRIQEKQTMIYDLQSQLAEKEKSVDGLQEINQSLGQTCNNDAKEIERLRELIVEQDNKINFYKSYYISFREKVIDELEKVKAELVKLGQDYSLNLCGIKIYNFVDDQINELKGE